MTEKSPRIWETVFTVNDYYDGPRNGVANLDGVPHIYFCDWDQDNDDWSSIYLLVPISPNLLTPVLEEWAIWLRWRAAYGAQSLTEDDKHPALASDRPRYDELHPLVEKILKVDVSSAIRAIPEFRGTLEPIQAFEVRWTRV